MLNTEENILEWRYTMRRQMQEVFPRVYLGPYSVAGKSQLVALKTVGITHIVCVRSEAEAHIVRPNFPDSFQYLVVSLGSRVPESGLASVVKESSAFIAESVDHGGRCLVHGLSGLSRSATLVLAYIIDAIKCTEQEALHHVAERRYCISIDAHFMEHLRQYATDVNRERPNSMQQEPPGKKRRIEQDDRPPGECDDGSHMLHR